jgi:Ras-related protein Rab-18
LAVVVYDITDRESYELLPWWFVERKKYVSESIVKIIVGNKADKVRFSVSAWHMAHWRHIEPYYATQIQEYARQVSTEEAAAYAARMGCLFIETSAKTAMGVCRAFRDVVERVAETPKPWDMQEPRGAARAKSPPSPASESETQVENDRDSENRGRARVIGGFVVTPNMIRFGGEVRGRR